ncbi:ATP/GTP-binding protein [Streptomyces chartreusis]|uniref:ATP/GTP-binding protein n=1 Tax=Streptomyces chartreusis TaxID=1969 RepID=UPI003D90078C
MLTRRILPTIAASLVVAASAASAYAGDGPDIDTGNCDTISFCVGVGVPGGGGSDQSGGSSGGSNSSGTGGQASSGDDSAPTCTMTMEKMDPQPPPGSMFYQGEGKVVYMRVCRDDDPNTEDLAVAVGVEPGEDVPAVDPAALAQQAVDKMKLAGPDIASPQGAGRYVVGMPMWMWVDESPTTYGPNSASASAGGVTVTATAKVTRIAWSMGDGSTVTCAGPGTKYTASYGKQESPTCGHTYNRASASQAAGKYAVTATSTWAINWQVTGGGGETGELTETRQTTAQVAIGELQVVR